MISLLILLKSQVSYCPVLLLFPSDGCLDCHLDFAVCSNLPGSGKKVRLSGGLPDAWSQLSQVILTSSHYTTSCTHDQVIPIPFQQWDVLRFCV